ncbi:hypothetical protein SUGI_0356250 [Cryptomeria japonica]|nr:hypothetical protein SUGI_0356250 [Cryptomeria japonica]
MASLSSQATVIGQPSSDNQRSQFSFEPDNERWSQLRKLLHNNVLSPKHFDTLAMEKEANDGVVRPLQALKIMALILPLIQFARTRQQSAPDCYLNCLLSVGEEEEDEEHNLKFSDEEIALNMFELFFLAVDSTSTALEWTLAYLIIHPKIQERAYQEVRLVVDGKEGGLLCLKETLRKESIAPLAIVHQTVEECKVMGFTIPAKSSVLINLHGVWNGPVAWKEPDQFTRERFLGNMDSDKVKMWYLPFGAGRRVCAGMDLANFHVPITLANLLLKFVWACVKEGSSPDLTRHIPSLLVSMKYPLEARITCR